MFKLGVVGLGMGGGHAGSILGHPAEWKLTAVCDVLEERLKGFTNAHTEVQGFTDYTEFLDKAELDGVILALPHDLHAPMANQAMEAGKHVIGEKPMGRNVKECEQMNAVAKKTGKILMVAQNWRYTPWVRAVKQVVDSGELGPLRAVRSDWLQNAVGDKRPGNWLLNGERAELRPGHFETLCKQPIKIHRRPTKRQEDTCAGLQLQRIKVCDQCLIGLFPMKRRIAGLPAFQPVFVFHQARPFHRSFSSAKSFMLASMS